MTQGIAQNRRPAEGARRERVLNVPPLALEPARFRFAFTLFLMVNAVLFIRPAEILPSLQALPIYELLMVSCLVASFGAIVPQFDLRHLANHPITVCVLAMAGGIFLSHLSHFNIYLARTFTLDFIKIVLFYLMLMGVVSSVGRLRLFLQVIAVYIFVIALLSLLHNHDFIHLQALEAMEQRERYDEESGERQITIRLQASGIFNDPNDFSLILITGILVVSHLMLDTKRLLVRLACVVPLGTYMYALALTRSRGGFLALMTGLGVMLMARLGIKKALICAVIGLPPMLVVFGGRQTNFNFEEGDTGHGRVAIWRDAIQLFKSQPLFGAGRGEMAEQVFIAAHNSYVHSFAELGLFGGAAFLGLFYIPVYCLRLRSLATIPPRGRESPAAAELRRWRPCILAIICSYGLGLCSLSRAYVVVTYLIVGIAAAYLHLAVAHGTIAAPPIGVMFRKILVASVGFLICLYVFVRVVT